MNEKGPKVSMKPIPTRPGLQGPDNLKPWTAGLLLFAIYFMRWRHDLPIISIVAKQFKFDFPTAGTRIPVGIRDLISWNTSFNFLFVCISKNFTKCYKWCEEFSYDTKGYGKQKRLGSFCFGLDFL